MAGGSTLSACWIHGVGVCGCRVASPAPTQGSRMVKEHRWPTRALLRQVFPHIRPDVAPNCSSKITAFQLTAQSCCGSGKACWCVMATATPAALHIAPFSLRFVTTTTMASLPALAVVLMGAAARSISTVSLTARSATALLERVFVSDSLLLCCSCACICVSPSPWRRPAFRFPA